MRPADAAIHPAHTALLRCLEGAFGGDPGARIFLQAALRAARRTSLPEEPAALLDFVRAHLLAAITDELGPRAVSQFLEEVTRAIRHPESGVEAQGHGAALDAAFGPGTEPSASPERRQPAQTSLRSHPSSAALPVASAVVPSSGRHRARLRLLLVHGDRFARATLARHLVAGGCDVTVVETFVDIATIVDTLPSLALVDLAASDVGPLLTALLARNPVLKVLALSRPGADDQVLRDVGVTAWEVALADTRPTSLVEMLRALSLR